MSLSRLSYQLKYAKRIIGKTICEYGLHLDRIGSDMNSDIAYLSTTCRHRKLLRVEDIMPSVNNAFVAESACLIGEVFLGNYSSVGSQSTFRAELNPIRVGCYSSIGDLTVLMASTAPPKGIPASITIGDHVTVGSRCTIYSSIIDDDVVIGDNVIVMEGAKIERGSRIESNTIVTPGTLILGNKLWSGNPAKFVRDLTEAEVFENYEKSYERWTVAKDRMESAEKGKERLSKETQEELENYLTENYFQWRAKYY